MADLDRLAVEDRVKYSFRISPNDIDKTCQAVCVENNASSPVPVEIVSGGFTSDNVNEFNPISSVAASATATVLTYTVPVGKTLVLREMEISSDSVSGITFEIDGNDEGFIRLGWNHWNDKSRFYGFKVAAGLVVKIIALNCSDTAAKFEGRMVGELV